MVGSNAIIIDEKGKRCRGRKYPWGVVEGKECRFFLPFELRGLSSREFRSLRLYDVEKYANQVRGEVLCRC